MDSTDSGESVFLPDNQQVFRRHAGVNMKVISRMRRRDKRLLWSTVRLTLAETGKNLDALSCHSSETNPRDRILLQRLFEVRLNGSFQLNTFNLWDGVGQLFSILDQPAFIIKQSRMIEIQYEMSNELRQIRYERCRHWQEAIFHSRKVLAVMFWLCFRFYWIQCIFSRRF